MLSTASLAAFFVAAIAISLLPGSSVSAVISAGLSRGLKAAFATEIGLQIGRFTMILLVALAVTAVRNAVEAAFDWIKYAGAAYLAWLGIRLLMRGNSLTLRENGEFGLVRHIAAGFLVTWTNPKSILFFGALLPQFVDPSGPAFAQVLVLGLILMAVALVTDMAYAALAVFARRQIGGAGEVLLNRVAGIILIGAAVWLAVQHG